MKRIVYIEDGAVAVIIPADCGLTIEQIAAKDVPTGAPYSIVDGVPEDRAERVAWAAGLSFTDGVGA